jgi:hypothetical protein
VQIVNNGAERQSLLGWTVRTDNNAYTFGDVSIFGEGAGRSRAGSNSPLGCSGEGVAAKRLLWDAAHRSWPRLP